MAIVRHVKTRLQTHDFFSPLSQGLGLFLLTIIIREVLKILDYVNIHPHPPSRFNIDILWKIEIILCSKSDPIELYVLNVMTPKVIWFDFIKNFLNIGKLKEKYIEGEGGLFCVIQ